VTMARGSEVTRVVWLGSGEAILVQSAHRSVLIDGSPHPLALLRRLGKELPNQRHVLDLIVVTDPRASNVAGLRTVLARYDVREVLDVGAQYPSASYASWRADLRTRKVPVFALRRGIEVHFDGTVLTVVSPDGRCPRPQDCAGIVRLDSGRHHVLLAGVSSVEDQRESLFRHGAISASAVVVTGPAAPDPGFVAATETRSRLVIVPGVAHRGTRLKDVSPVVIAQW
jgi:beta-lactamase superfamily II metal-dependent hydrolase